MDTNIDAIKMLFPGMAEIAKHSGCGLEVQADEVYVTKKGAKVILDKAKLDISDDSPQVYSEITDMILYACDQLNGLNVKQTFFVIQGQIAIGLLDEGNPLRWRDLAGKTGHIVNKAEALVELKRYQPGATPIIHGYKTVRLIKRTLSEQVIK